MFSTLFFLFFLSTSFLFAQEKTKEKEINQVAEVSCGQCNFQLKTQKGCDLAVRIDGKAYFVDGTKIDDHGDAHADDGFCNAIKKAQVKGTIVKGRFKATSFKLLKE
ncbi:hypothetical protein FA046_14290 [Pedobacter cryophilus]|uniref:Glutaminyl-tRNA synthetase n=1 Tax=Pedobacter cryophilus TaxID=2571271 RepID=A0A4U1BVL6_9SPHI|nr:hypothetical protein FA046_14290 [Pedobacter cryophilus]